jgi:gamma-glutamylcyclotransferase (GGCT)/AIG2-like uncharacterized protein YtfP
MKLFVYGTLKRGGRLEKSMRGAQFICRDMVRGYGMWTNGAFPAIRPEAGAVVHGEVYDVPPETLARIDEIESPAYFRRVPAVTVKDHKVELYEYVLDILPGRMSEVENGYWITFSEKVDALGKHVRPTVKLIGENGNAFAVLVAFKRAARKAGWPVGLIEAVRNEAMSGDYNHLLATIQKYAEVV